MKEDEQSMNTFNPFSAEMSGYGFFDGKSFTSAYPVGSPMHAFHQDAHSYFRGFVLGQDFPCVAGQSVVRTNHYALCAYPDITDPTVAEGVCHDLIQTKQQFKKFPFESFMAAFQLPIIHDQIEGAEYLYALMLNMHKADQKHGFNWDTRFSDDPDSPNFAFSIVGKGHFLSFFYPQASSETRSSQITMVLFNEHAVFQMLRSKGAFDKLKAIIRSRIPVLHPHLGDHGDVNEFTQYALVDTDDQTQILDKAVQQKVLGVCPFNHRVQQEGKTI